MKSLNNIVLGAALLSFRKRDVVRREAKDYYGRRLLVELPGRALEDRRGRDQGGARKAGAKYISADAQASPTSSSPTSRA